MVFIISFICSDSSVYSPVEQTVAPPTQGTWRSNDYVSAVRLVDYGWFYGGVGGAVYIHIG